MKVSVTLVLDVDVECWEMDYGVAGAAAIRADVKLYVASAVGQLTDSLEVSSSK